MLPKNNRLTKKKDFDTVFKKGESAKGDFFIAKALKNSLQYSRFGFVVSKKISPKATVRNAVKRRLRDAVFSQLGFIKNPKDVIIITLTGSQKREFLEIQKTVVLLCKKLKVL